MTLARDAVKPPDPPHNPPSVRYVLICHPGYDDASNNALLKLYAPDNTQQGRGLWAQYALDACGIITGNRWDGWLSETRDPAAAAVAAKSVLTRQLYYFHLPTALNHLKEPYLPYTIVPTFRDWTFPHDQVPAHWSQALSGPGPNPSVSLRSFAPSNFSLAVTLRDDSCRITGCQEGVQVAHVCPRSEKDWWEHNGMWRQIRGAAVSMDDLQNAFLLRSDLHIAFDMRKLVFVPKPAAGSEGFRIVTHLLEPSPELEHLYHNREMQPIDVSYAVMFARFAWSIFPKLGNFLKSGVPRRLAKVESTKDWIGDDGWAPASRCTELLSKKNPERSESPKKKRKPTEDDGENKDEDVRPLYYESDVRSRGRQQKRHKARRRHGHQHHSASSATSLRSPTTVAALESESPAAHPSPTIPEPATPDPTPPSPSHSILSASPNRKTIVQTWLEQERLRSDPHEQWQKKQEWAKEVWKGHVTLDAQGARDWYEACGVEFRDDEI